MTHGRTYGEQRFSPLARINDQNAGELGLAWYLDMGTRRGLEATPLVVDGVMYTSGSWNVIHAIDAGSGRELWRYDPHTQRERLRSACCDAVNRGLAVWKGKVYEGLLDGRLIAVDAATGGLIWEVQTIDQTYDYSVNGAPRIVNGKVIIGNGGAEFGVRGYVTAYDAETGEQLWRFYTVPGNPAAGFESPAMEMAAKTWTGEWWKYGGGGTAWDAFAYDPELNLLYIGVGNGSPWPRDIRSPGGGDNLFLSSIVAVNADTGEYVWHYQTTPGDNWDYTATQHMILADIEIDGKPRKVIMQAPKNGFFYVIDRQTGELLSANNFIPVTWATHVDMATGRPVENPDYYYTERGKIVVPGPLGGHSWQPMSYSPLTGLVYIPTQITSFPYSKTPVRTYKKGLWNLGMNEQVLVPGGPPPEKADEAPPNSGTLIAWDPKQNREVWRIQQDGPWNGGILTTAGNLMAQGNANGNFVIYRADNGEVLWRMPVQTGALAGPVTYMVDGEQYIAVNAGWGGAWSLTAGGKAQGGKPIATGRLLAFKLGGAQTLPPPPEAEPIPQPPPLTASEETIAHGALLFNNICFVCHGAGAVSGGSTADLRHMAPETHAAFKEIVLGGAMAGAGMASFADVLSEDDVEAIHAYLIQRAHDEQAELAGQ